MSSPLERSLGTIATGREIGLNRPGDLFVWVECYSPESGHGCRDLRWVKKRGRYDAGTHRLCSDCVKTNWTPYKMAIEYPEARYSQPDLTAD